MSLQAVLLVGGQGTRLRSIVSDRPKPMALVGDVPFLRYLVQWLSAWGVDRVVFAAGYMADYLQANLTSLQVPGVSLRLLAEEMPLGTGGALKNAETLVDETFLVLNGDTFCELDLEVLVAAHRTRQALATLALVQLADASDRGVVAIDEMTGRIVRFDEKVSQGSPGTINAGVYVMERRTLAQIPSGRFISLERDVFPQLAGIGRLYGVAQPGSMVDMGTPAGLTEAERLLPKLFEERGWL